MGTSAMRRIAAVFALTSGLALAPRANAQLVETTIQPGGDASWSATAGRTAGSGNTLLQAEVGWPGIGFTYLKGLDERSDVGLHVGFNYGLEGTSDSVAGLVVGVPYRRTLTTMGDTALAFQMRPGVHLYSNDGPMVGIGGPFGVVAGFHLSPPLTVDVGADFPVLVSFSNPTGFMFGPQFGAGAEYLIDRNLAVTARFRVGPQFGLDTGSTSSQTGFITLIGLAYNAR